VRGQKAGDCSADGKVDGEQNELLKQALHLNLQLRKNYYELACLEKMIWDV